MCWIHLILVHECYIFRNIIGQLKSGWYHEINHDKALHDAEIGKCCQSENLPSVPKFHHSPNCFWFCTREQSSQAQPWESVRTKFKFESWHLVACKETGPRYLRKMNPEQPLKHLVDLVEEATSVVSQLCATEPQFPQIQSVNVFKTLSSHESTHSWPEISLTYSEWIQTPISEDFG